MHPAKWSRATLSIALAGIMFSTAASADDARRPATENQTQAEPEQRPLAPPPGISIIPSVPMRPPQMNGQVPGCPAQNLKPLELLV